MGSVGVGKRGRLGLLGEEGEVLGLECRIKGFGHARG